MILQDGPEFMAEEAKLFNYPFPYLFDEVHLDFFGLNTSSLLVLVLLLLSKTFAKKQECILTGNHSRMATNDCTNRKLVKNEDA